MRISLRRVPNSSVWRGACGPAENSFCADAQNELKLKVRDRRPVLTGMSIPWQAVTIPGRSPRRVPNSSVCRGACGPRQTEEFGTSPGEMPGDEAEMKAHFNLIR